MSDTPPPPGNEATSYPEINDATPPPPGVEVHENDVLKRKKTFSWRNFGGDGFLVSVAFHLILLVLGLFYVIKKYTEPKKPDTEVFATGAGGGANGDRAKQFEHKMQRKISTPLKSPSRIVSKSANASVALPSTPTTSTAAFASGLSAGGMSKGSGGGSGGGEGTGIGIGKGGGKNFVSGFLGMKMHGAARVAVFMDASGSMTPYLTRVETEAKRIFPEADVYRANGIYVVVEDGVVAWGTKRPANNKKSFGFNSDNNPAAKANNPENFSEAGKKILRAHGDDFAKGSVGAWFDHIITEKYDAVILFSDFNDGFKQTNGGTVIFQETTSGAAKDERRAADKIWENRWFRTLEKAKAGGAPKVYCFSINTEPQSIWRKCAEVSGGAIRMVTWMKKPGGKPPPEEADSDIAGEIARGAKNKKDLPVR